LSLKGKVTQDLCTSRRPNVCVRSSVFCGLIDDFSYSCADFETGRCRVRTCWDTRFCHSNQFQSHLQSYDGLGIVLGSS